MTTRVNPKCRLEDQGIEGLGRVYYNLPEPALITEAVVRGEGRLGLGGAFLVSTGAHTGRSPKDKFVVRTPDVEDSIWWDNNAAMAPDAFDRLHHDMLAHMQGRDYFVQDLFAGADPDLRLDVRVITELAWHGLFIRHLLRRPEAAELDGFTPEFTIINCPGFTADPDRHGCRGGTVIALNLHKKLILIGGTAYAGENKKSVFTLLNYLLPEKGIMPMHCSANHAPDDPTDSAIFFGLSGTGKTTLSADPSRALIGDDEHGWSDRGIFNFEGGCYAKTINLSPEAEPEIHATTARFGTVIENMVFDPLTLELDFQDNSITDNMRCAYPLEAISNASKTSLGGHPKNVIMLTCDAYGVLPPIARLSPAQAMYHFLSGFTAKTPGTEVGVTEPIPTFSTCFGAPFMPRRPEVYGRLLADRIGRHGKGRDRTGTDLLDLLRRAVHAAPPRGLRRPAAREDRQARRNLLAGEHRLDRRRLWHRVADADQGHPRAADSRAGRIARRQHLPQGSELRLRRAGVGSRRGRDPAGSAPHVG